MQKPVDSSKIDFQIRSIPDFWDWIYGLPRNSQHPLNKRLRTQLPYFDGDEYNRHERGIYIFAGWGDFPLIAVSKIEFAADYGVGDDRLWSMYTEVAHNFRHQGIGTALKRRCFEYAAEQGKPLLTSSLSADGAAYLLPKFVKLAEETGVSIAFGEEDTQKYSDIINGCLPTPARAGSHFQKILRGARKLG